MGFFKLFGFVQLITLLFFFQNLNAAEYDPNCPETALNFSISPVGYGGVSELKIDLTFPDYGGGSFYYSIYGAVVNIPEELLFADPANVKSSCGEISVAADEGAGTLTFSNGGLRPFT